MSKIKREIKEVDEFEIPLRQYTDIELRDFHNKIQRFWGEERLSDKSEVVRHFDFDGLAVAYGAFSKIPVGDGTDGRFYYRAVAKEMVTYKNKAGEMCLDTEHPTRYEQLINLWNQYVFWREKQDWIEDKKLEGYEEMAKDVVF